MKQILFLLLLIATPVFGQVGVNTTNPDPSSMLDISATNKGVLVPRVSLPNVTTTMLDGSNTAATGLLIWNTNAATTGGNGVGFYFFNGTQWMPITQTASSDHDIYEVGSTNPPNSITDNKFTEGSLAIGSNTAATGVLDVDNATKATSIDVNNTFGTNPIGIDLNLTSNAAGKTGIKTQFNGTAATGTNSFIQNTDNMVGNTSRTAINNDFSGTSSSISTSITGLKNDFKSTSNYYAILYGVSNSFASTTNAWNYGMLNSFTNGGSTPSSGVVNAFNGTSTGSVTGISNSSNNYNGSITGLDNSFSGTGDGIHYGVNNILTGIGTGDKYGVYNYIPTTAGGTQYGIYSDVLKSGSYAGYFLGNVSVGTTTLNNYILPPSRGINGQIMQTDGSGNVSWVTPAVATDTDNQTIDVLSLTGDTLNISLQDDAVATQTLNLSAIDNQTTDVFSLTGSTLNLSLQNDGVATQTVDLSSIVGDDDWTDVGTDIERQTGNVYIGDTAATNNNLYISNQLIDWDNLTYFLDPATANRVNEIQLDDGSVTDPSITFTEQNTGFFSPSTDATAYSADGTEAFRIHSNGNIAIGQTIDPNYSLSISTLTGSSNIEIGNKDFNDNVMNIFHDGDRANALNVSALSTYTLASRSSISASNALGASAIDIAKFEAGGFNTYGVRSIITNNLAGIEYGIYSEALQANGYAGYFLGRTSIGTTALNNYILPPSRGTNGQIMQTDGSGNVSWVTPTVVTDTDDQATDVFNLTGTTLNLSLQNDGVATQTVDLSSLKDQDWYEIGTTTAPNAITDNKYTQGSITLGTNTLATGVLDIDNSTKTTSLDINNTYSTNPVGINIDINSSSGGKNGINITQNGTFSGFGGVGSMLQAVDNCSGDYNRIAFYNVMNGSSTDTSIYAIGMRNAFNSNFFVGNYYGVSNDDYSTSNGSRYGVNNNFIGTGSGNNYGVYNFFSSTGAGNKYGVYNNFPTTAGGTHYGIYSNVLKTGSFAGYFLGNVSIGTTTTNNYILPPSRGTNGQIMQTDGLGNITWVNPTVDTDTDNQIIDVLSLTGDTLNISLQDDAIATQTLNLSAIDNQGTDVFNLTGTTLNLSIQNDGVATQTVDLSSLDTDNQTIDVLSLTGNTLNISLQDDAVATQTVDLSSLANDWKLTGNAGTIAGTNFIGTTDAQDLDFRTNNITKLTLTQRGQLSITNTGGSVLIGSGAGDADDFTLNQNTFVGTVSGELTSSGNLNSALGFNSLNDNTIGVGNTAVGANALNVNVDGNNNTGLGRGANVSTTSLANATAIGFNSTVNASNKVRIGNASVTVVEGQVAYTNPSDARFKFNVKENVPGLDFIKKLKPVTYNFDTKKFDEHLNKNRNRDEIASEDFSQSTAIVRTGFLAQDVEKICNDLDYNFDGLHIPDANNPTDNYGIAYSQFIMPIVKAVQEQQEIIEKQKTELEQLKSELEKYKSLEERIKALENK
ncbi:MAG TPA: tail fiber domain-containing protein [Flavobacterium lutivivi]|nr:tail fiber domain-containing protein [Flavobacterium lutivivi]